MKTINEYIQRKHIDNFNSMITTIDGVECLMIKDMSGAYIYLTFPTVQKGQFKTDRTGKEKPLKMNLYQMDINLKVPERKDNPLSPFWSMCSLYDDLRYFMEAFNNGTLKPFFEWFRKVTGETHIIIGVYKGVNDILYLEIDADNIKYRKANFNTEGYCCLMYSVHKGRG